MSKALATKKVAAVLLGFGMVLAVAGVASAQTTTTTTTSATTLATLQAQVQALLAQIASLQGTGTATTGSGACFTFTENEQQGSSGGQVMWIQEFLNGHGFTVAASGAGSPGNETSYYGALTAAAVSKFQEAYASSILTPEGLTTGTGNWYAGTRAEANAICAGSTTTTTTTTTGTTSGAGITVTAGVQPANSLAPALANRVPFTTFTLTNNSSAAVTVNGIDVQLTGLANTGAFAGVVLVDSNGNQIGTSRNFNSNDQTEIGTPFTLNAGESETYTVAGDMASVESAYAGQVASIAVTGVDTTVPVSGTLPITGASQTINSSLTIGTATAQRSSYDPDSERSEPIGTTGVIFSGVRITAGSAENEKLYSITWNQTGSVGSTDLSNLVTVINGTSYPVTVDSTGRYFTATIPGGLTIDEGQSVDAYIQGDITGSDASGRTVEFDIYRPSDIYLVGQTYGYGITPVGSGTFETTTNTAGNSAFYYPCGTNDCTAGTPFYQGAVVDITAGTLSTVGSAGTVGSQNIAINVPNQPLGGFTTDFTGEAVQVQGMTIDVATSTNTDGTDNLTNVSVVASNGQVIAGPVNETWNGSQGELVFTSSITFPVGETTYTVEGTVGSGAVNGETYTLSTTPSSWVSPQGETSGSTVSLSGYGTITMSTMTVQGGSLVISAASTPASTTVAPGSNNFVLANINLDASQSGEDVRLSSLPIVVNLAGSAVGQQSTVASDLTNCQLYNGSTALNNQAIGSSNWDQVSGSLLEANFVFQNAITIPKGTVTTLSLECNISSSIPGGYEFSAGVSSSYGASPTGVQSGDSIVTPSDSTDEPVPGASGTMTVGSATLSISSPTPASYTQVAGGTTGVTVGTFTLQPMSDTVNLQNVGLTLSSADASSSDISRAYIFNSAGTQVGSVIFTGSPTGGYYYATSTITTGTSLPQSQQSVFTIKADVNQIGLGQAGTSGHEILIGVSDVQGVGNSSGTSVNSGPLTTTGSGVAIFRSYPTIAASSYLPSNGVADGRLLAFSITANSNNEIGISKLSFTIATSSNVTVTNPQLYVYTDSGFSQIAGGTTGGIAGNTTFNSASNSDNTVTTIPTPLEIPAGTTEYFLLKAASVSYSGSNNSYNVATTLLGDGSNDAPYMYASSTVPNSSYFVWSPNSTTTSGGGNLDWTNGYGISGLPSIGITENRTN